MMPDSFTENTPRARGLSSTRASADWPSKPSARSGHPAAPAMPYQKATLGCHNTLQAIPWCWLRPEPPDPAAQSYLAVTATLLSAAVGSRVELASVATGEPRVTDALRRAGARLRRQSVRPVIC